MARSQRRDGGGGPQNQGPDEEPAAGVDAARPEAATGTSPFTEPGPSERVYAVAFGRVWLAALAAAAMGRWTVTASDPVRGEILAEVRGLIRRTTRPARVRIVLDRMGLTRVDATFLTESGDPAENAEPRQIASFHRQLETRLRRDSGA